MAAFGVQAAFPRLFAKGRHHIAAPAVVAAYGQRGHLSGQIRA